MKAYTRNASASWLGTHQHGKGAITAPIALVRKMPYLTGSAPTRGATSPPELMAAAHAGSFAMSLANELQIAGFSPKQIDTTAAVTMEPRTSGWRITQIHLDVVATVARVLQADFVGVALRAKASAQAAGCTTVCPEAIGEVIITPLPRHRVRTARRTPMTGQAASHTIGHLTWTPKKHSKRRRAIR